MGMSPDVLSKVGRQTWQSLRKRSATPRLAGSAYAPARRPVPIASLVPPARRARPDGPGERAPTSLERAIVALVSERAVPEGELATRIEARWPDLLALRGRPESSVQDALASVVRKGLVALDGERRAVAVGAPSGQVGGP